MATCSVNDLLADAKGLNNLSGEQMLSIQVMLLGTIAGLDMTSPTVINQLLSDGRCIQCLSPQQQQLIIAQLLCNISSSGLGGGSIGVGSPEGVVTASPGATYYDKTDPNAPDMWVKVTGTGNTGWVQLIS